MRFFVLAVAFTFAATPALADDGPSYGDTTAFVIGKANVTFNSYVASDTGIHHSASARVSFPENCVLEKEHVARDNGNIIHRTVDTVSVEELDPSRVEIRAGQVNIYTFESRRTIVSREWNAGRGWSNTRFLDSIWLNTFDRDVNAPKLQRALVHLINLCGGREELF